MGLAEEIFERCDRFADREKCWAVRECTVPHMVGEEPCWVTDTRPDARLEAEWETVVQHSPVALPDDFREIFVVFGDDCGDMVYLYGEGPEGLGVYMCDKGCCFEDYPKKIADTFTQIVTDEETQRVARNLYRFGEDKGGDGR